jgi:hypothetical protein
MQPNFDPKLQAMLQSLYRNGAANANFLPVPEELESYSDDAIVESRNSGRYADPHPLVPGTVKAALESMKERAETGTPLQGPLERLGAELLRVMSLTADWDADIPAADVSETRPILVESRFTGTVEETFAHEGDFDAFARGLRVRLSAKYPASPEKLEILEKKVLYPGAVLNQVKVLFRVTFKLGRELDVPGPPVPVFATVSHPEAPLPAFEREIGNVQYLAP